LHETAGAVGVFLEVHVSTPSAHGGAGKLAGPLRRPAGSYVGAARSGLKRAST